MTDNDLDGGDDGSTDDGDDPDIDLRGATDANWLSAGRELSEWQTRCEGCGSVVNKKEIDHFDGVCRICDRGASPPE